MVYYPAKVHWSKQLNDLRVKWQKRFHQQQECQTYRQGDQFWPSNGCAINFELLKLCVSKMLHLVQLIKSSPTQTCQALKTQGGGEQAPKCKDKDPKQNVKRRGNYNITNPSFTVVMLIACTFFLDLFHSTPAFFLLLGNRDLTQSIITKQQTH